MTKHDTHNEKGTRNIPREHAGSARRWPKTSARLAQTLAPSFCVLSLTLLVCMALYSTSPVVMAATPQAKIKAPANSKNKPKSNPNPTKQTAKSKAAAAAPSQQPTAANAVAGDGATAKPVLRDYIAAMVGSEPIMFGEVQARFERMRAQDKTLADTAESHKRALDGLIDEKLILLAARDAGEKVSDNELDQLIKQQAQAQGLTEDAYKAQVQASGQTWDSFRQRARDQILATRYLQAKMRELVKVPVAELDAAVQTAKNSISAKTVPAVNLGHILVLLPKDKNDPKALKEREARIEKAWQRLQNGEDFATVAREVSEASEGKRGGEIGLLPEKEYPPEFLAAVAEVPLGAVSRIVRSTVGFHILKVIDRQRVMPTDSGGAPAPGTIPEVRVRHILLRADSEKSAQAAVAQLADMRKQIVAKKITFAQAAKQYSADGSAQTGGELPWAGPGVYVPEFEQALASLKPGEISKPVVTRFGVHLIELLDTRRRLLSDQELRAAIEQRMQVERSEKAYQDWVNDLRKKQFVEYRSAPLS